MSKIIQTAGHDQLGTFAPIFADLNDNVLFGDRVWGNDAIDMKTKSTIVISVFMGRGLADSSLKYHLMTARKNGITKEEIAAIITHAAFYAGWPMAWAAFNMAKEVWSDDAPETETGPSSSHEGRAASNTSRDQFQREILFPIGEPNDAFAQYFTGQSYLYPVSTEQVPMFNVSFEPGCRNNWHIHHARSGGGQMLICIGGRGWYQEEGKEAVELTPGTIIHIPAEVKHWHGAAADSWMAHLAIEVAGEDTSTEWCEAVSSEVYESL